MTQLYHHTWLLRDTRVRRKVLITVPVSSQSIFSDYHLTIDLGKAFQQSTGKDSSKPWGTKQCSCCRSHHDTSKEANQSEKYPLSKAWCWMVAVTSQSKQEWLEDAVPHTWEETRANTCHEKQSEMNESHTSVCVHCICSIYICTPFKCKSWPTVCSSACICCPNWFQGSSGSNRSEASAEGSSRPFALAAFCIGILDEIRKHTTVIILELYFVAKLRT